MTTQSEEEAVELLEEHRAELIEAGYEVAVELARENGFVYAQLVIAEMRRRGSEVLKKHEESGGSNHWVSAVFKGSKHKDEWEKAGTMKIGDRTRNVHAAPRNVWKLAGTAPSLEQVLNFSAAGGDGAALDRPNNTKIRRAIDGLRGLYRYSRMNGYKLRNEEEVIETLRWLANLSGAKEES